MATRLRARRAPLIFALARFVSTSWNRIALPAALAIGFECTFSASGCRIPRTFTVARGEQMRVQRAVIVGAVRARTLQVLRPPRVSWNGLMVGAGGGGVVVVVVV